MIQSTVQAPPKIKIPSVQPEFWESIGVFPDALGKNRSGTQIATENKKKLTAIAKPELAALCDHFQIPYAPKNQADDLAAGLLTACDPNSIMCLLDFVKRKSEFISRTFQRLIPSNTKTALVSHLSRIHLKPLTELLILFSQNPDNLKEIFYSHLWESKRTYVDFEIDRPLPKNFNIELEHSLADFENSLTKVWGAEVRKFGQFTLASGITVIALDREYTPSIHKDFRESFCLHYRCGGIAFGVSKDRDFVHVKLANSELIDGIQTFLENLYSVKLTRQQSQTFSGYEAEELKTALLGGYSSNSKLQIVATSFRRTALASRAALCVSGVEQTSSVRQDLITLKEKGIVSLDALDDIEYLQVSLNEKVVRIDVEQVSGGALRFSLDDSNCSADHTDELKGEFQDVFGIPLNRLIDPQKLAMGHVRIITYLLNMRFENELLAYQREQFDYLTKHGYLSLETLTGNACSSSICLGYRRPVSDTALKACTVCDRPLEETTYKEATRSNSRVIKLAKEVLKEAGWDLGAERTFEGKEYYPLIENSHAASDPVWLLHRESLPEAAKTQMERSSQALIVLTTRTDDRYVYVDSSGIGYVSISYMIAAQQDAGRKSECVNKCKAVIEQLQSSSVHRIEKAAQISIKHLREGTAGDKGNVYETEIFNVLRSILPYSYKLGREGKAEPDGFVSIPVYGDGDGNRDLGDVNSWNYTYDAKHSDKPAGYDLGREEQRKIIEYIDSVRRKRALMGKNHKLKAHVIISNNLSDRKMKSAAKYVFGDDGVKKGNKDVKLILMREDFLTTLYEEFRKNRDAIQRRLPIVGECLVEVLDSEPKDGYVCLQKADAVIVVKTILKSPEIESVIKRGEVADGLDDKN